MKEIDNICAIVVTYNRKNLLEKCIYALLNQTHSLEKIMVIDNHSNDGTREMLENDFSSTIVESIILENNIGGAGGFAYGLKIGFEKGYDWFWLLDDDTIPQKNCVEKIAKASSYLNKEDQVSFFASSIYGPNGEYMNVPEIDSRPSPNGYAGWYDQLKNGMVKIRTATFVSIVINKDAIRKCGFPCKEFFIWGDDSEYTMRLTEKFGIAYLVGESRAIHLRNDARALAIEDEDDVHRLKMFHYFYRNTFIYRRYYNDNITQKIKNLVVVLKKIKLLKASNGRTKFKMVLQGYLESIFEYKRFKNLIDRQIRNEQKN